MQIDFTIPGYITDDVYTTKPAPIVEREILSQSSLYFGIGIASKGRLVVDSHKTTCREYVQNVLSKLIVVKEIPIKDIRIILFYTTDAYAGKIKEEVSKNILDKGLEIVNLFSRKHGWSPASLKEYPGVLRHPTKSRVLHSCVLKPSVNWLKTPQMVSLLLLLLRFGASNLFKDVVTYEDVFKALKVEIDDLTEHTPLFSFKNDLITLATYVNLLEIVFDNYKAIFGTLKPKEAWDTAEYLDMVKKHNGKVHLYQGVAVRYEGIQRLLSGISYNYAFTKAVSKEAEAAGIVYKSITYADLNG